MARKGARHTQIPTLWHLGYNEPFRVMRKRKGDKRWRNIEYASLTRASAQRWLRLVAAGKARHIRDTTREMVIGFGVTTLAEVQRDIRARKAQARENPSQDRV